MDVRSRKRMMLPCSTQFAWLKDLAPLRVDRQLVVACTLPSLLFNGLDLQNAVFLDLSGLIGSCVRGFRTDNDTCF